MDRREEELLSERLSVQVGALRLKSPLIGASGTCGFGAELNEVGSLAYLGALVTKTITPLAREGNPPPRTWETAAGLLNSIGLANPGLQAFLREIAPTLERLPCPVVVSIGAEEPSGYVSSAEALQSVSSIAALELNLSCPNVAGGLDLSRSPQALAEVTRAVRSKWDRPLWVKVTPSVPDLGPLVAAAADSGADAAVVANTHPAMAINWRTGRSRLGRPTGGLSGPAVKPLTVRLVYEAACAAALPVIASGGVAEAQDVLELMVAGASAVQLGSILLREPEAPRRFTSELLHLLDSEGIEEIRSLVGTFSP